MDRMMVDCRKMPSDMNCQMTIAGTHDEVLELAVLHAVTTHGHEDGPELRAGIEEGMEPVDAAMA